MANEESFFNKKWRYYASKFLEKYSEVLPVSSTDKIPDRSNITSAGSVELKKIVSPESYSYIANLGHSPKEIKTYSPKITTPITVVTGIHRSGTSCIAGILDKCGISIGDYSNLISNNESAFDNQKGYGRS